MTGTRETRPSVNGLAARLVDGLAAEPDRLRIAVDRGTTGERRIDLGAKAAGGLEAGRRLAEICMGGLGTVALAASGANPRWPFAVVVHSSDPVLACLGSQYAGWSLNEPESGTFVLGSGPARARAGVEKLFEELGYRDRCERAVLALETDKPLPQSLVAKVAADCGVQSSSLDILYAPTWSLAGTVQIVARVLEVALHKTHALGFPLHHIVDGIGTAPLAPPVPDFVAAMGRTNDAIIYGGRVQLHVRGSDDAAEDLANRLPSAGSRDHGRPFADVFAAVNGDFYAIDAMLFSPAEVTVTNLDTGRSFHAGKIEPVLLDKSFG